MKNIIKQTTLYIITFIILMGIGFGLLCIVNKPSYNQKYGYIEYINKENNKTIINDSYSNVFIIDEALNDLDRYEQIILTLKVEPYCNTTIVTLVKVETIDEKTLWELKE